MEKYKFKQGLSVICNPKPPKVWWINKNRNASQWYCLSPVKGLMSSYLKGYGKVNYLVQEYGVGTRGFDQEMGMVIGNFNFSNPIDYSPEMIAGYGASVSYGIGLAIRVNSFGFSSLNDALNINTEKAVISGEINGWNFGIRGFKGSGSSTYSVTTLKSPKTQE